MIIDLVLRLVLLLALTMDVLRSLGSSLTQAMALLRPKVSLTAERVGEYLLLVIATEMAMVEAQI